MLEDGRRQLLLLSGLFQAELGRRSCATISGTCRTFSQCQTHTDTPVQSEHKVIHKAKSNFLTSLFPPKVVSEPDPATGHYNPFPNFQFAGSLRPVYPLSPRRTVPASIPHPDYAIDGYPRSERKFMGRQITILNKKEQEGMRKVCRLAREVLDIAARELKPGITTDYLDEVVHKACLERNVSRPVKNMAVLMTATC